MENPDFANLSEQTKAEMAAGKKAAAANAAALAAAEKLRAAENPPPDEEAAKAVAEAKPLIDTGPMAENPVAGKSKK